MFPKYKKEISVVEMRLIYKNFKLYLKLPLLSANEVIVHLT